MHKRDIIFTSGDEPRARRGRPRRGPVDYFKSKIWFNSVVHATGKSTPHQLLAYFQPSQIRQRDGRPGSSGAWDKYKAGRRVPSIGRLADGTIGIASFIGSWYPETLRVLQHPLWLALEKRQLESGDVDTALNRLDRVLIFGWGSSGSNLSARDLLMLSSAYPLPQQIDHELAFDYLGLIAVLIRVDVRAIKDMTREEEDIPRNLKTALAVLSVSPWIETLYKEFFGFLRDNLWHDLLDSY